uniref:Uncharacterized protein n=1 Tax=Equus asinus TaxID=9793 RepID=A0A9L0IN31_EQUAS
DGIVKSGWLLRQRRECQDVQPPDGKPKDCMLQILRRDGRTISLCSESTEDCLAQKFMLQDSRINTMAVASSPPPYTAYAAPTPEQAYGYGPYGGPANQVIICERYGDNDSDLTVGMLAGAATGMALGSLFWVFWSP